MTSRITGHAINTVRNLIQEPNNNGTPMPIKTKVLCDDCGYHDEIDIQIWSGQLRCPKCGLAFLKRDNHDQKQLPPEKVIGKDIIKQVASETTESTKPPLEEWNALSNPQKTRWYNEHKNKILADVKTLGHDAARRRWRIGAVTFHSLINRWEGEAKREAKFKKEQESKLLVKETPPKVYKSIDAINKEIATWARSKSSRFSRQIFETYVEMQTEFCSPSELAQTLKELKDLVNKTNGSKEYIDGAIAVINTLERMFIRIDSLCPKYDEGS